ncbi:MULTISPECIES: magnesium/cobalt transporter CorA [Mammaliicoccus]|uniref:Magnesium transport protein CorA n=1 Tax=Mammaliicoccus sciuri TaxID=1296 RepID=A0AAJ4SG99_MAMSC|nr:MULTISPECIES: magnesium/cobalt transporter CorA [Mammaliicoccus]EZX18107.1 magnesium and cobalt transporter CorA [Staphylococcus aureus C0673]MCD8836818.1 magnesium/cobalt transporter CorA [Mammaliicoccus sciuri]MCJ0943792.1 magnesium/cobalt transporter CorA [Mammaliicoccus sciuri]MCJ0966110.1 magnesium/cobalt transporter CorA [Mammaliicoccus sciuri]MCJ1749492.1 magnesium/cobalt transporter CorA [Mammaliicoccus sciuri]
MIKTYYVNLKDEIKETNSPKDISEEKKWIWVDLNEPTKEESEILVDYFNFHPLSVEDATQVQQRPKFKQYDDYQFIVFHALDLKTLESEEVDIFIGEDFIVTFHRERYEEIDTIKRKLFNETIEINEPKDILLHILDDIVDNYFPFIYDIEDKVFNFEDRHNLDITTKTLIDDTFDLREELLIIKRTVQPMKDLVYRMREGKVLHLNEQQFLFITHINDHLMKQMEMVDSSREMTSDIRDNYISLNSFKMNNIMKILTIYSVVFMPLTLIAGIYGMNFTNMPELEWHDGYYIVLVIMAVIAIIMLIVFKKKRWF